MEKQYLTLAKFYFLFSSGVKLFLWHYKLDFSFYYIYGTIFNWFDFPIYGFVNCVNFLGPVRLHDVSKGLTP